MSERDTPGFEQWAGRRIRVSWIILWTAVFFLASAGVFSVIPFGQAPPKPPPVTAQELESMKLRLEALEAALTRAGSGTPEVEGAAGSPETAREVVRENGNQGD